MRIAVFSLILILLSLQKEDIMAQTSVIRGNVYTISGIGFGLTGGKAGEVFKPKVSTKLGLDISIGKKGFFLYPSANLLIFGYDQKEPDPEYNYLVKSGRSTITNFSIAIGNRQKAGSFNIYEYAGAGGAIRKEPRMSVNTAGNQILLSFKKSNSMSLTAGVGAEYMIGQFIIFAEGSYFYNSREVQDRKLFIFPVQIGFKSNISTLFNRK
jgi:hypothetical protein